jgi:hypothetical protein
MTVTERRARVIAGTLLLLATLFLRQTLSAQETRPSGAWILDAARSDTLRSPIRERSDSAGPGQETGVAGPGYAPPAAEPPPGAPDIEGGRRPPGAGREAGRVPDEKGLRRLRQTLALARKAPARIEIDSSRKTVRFTDHQGFETTLSINGRTTRESVFEGGDVSTKAGWSDETLVIERRVDGGGRVTERYALGLGGIRLLSFVQVKSMLQPLEFTRQFVRAE